MSEFDKCMKRGALRLFENAGHDVVESELRSAREDLADSEFLMAHAKSKRATITAYYAMFHAARAAILAKGYVEKSHYCLLVAFRELYGAEAEGAELARGIERARVLRENADYHAEFPEEAAQAALVVARRFLAFVEQRTQEPVQQPTVPVAVGTSSAAQSDARAAADAVSIRLIGRMPGKPWEGIG